MPFPEHSSHLAEVANAMVARGRGILAADESTGTIQKRFDTIGVKSTEETRRRYREILFTTAGAERFVSAVILFDETLRQATQDGVPFPQFLHERGIIPGIKVDRGVQPLAGARQGEVITEGLDGLRGRLDEYRSLGAQFAKWRAVIGIDGVETPSDLAIHANAHALARYAAECQAAGIVPIVEPEVLMDGGAMNHDLARAEEVTHRTLAAVFEELDVHGVELGGMILKPSMVIPGKKAEKASPHDIAEATLRVYRATVPEAVPGCVFLSGGQGDVEATTNMNEINAMGPHPWALSFSFGRALQAPVLDAWRGLEENVPAAQAAFLHRAEMNSLATLGQYSPDMENR